MNLITNVTPNRNFWDPPNDTLRQKRAATLVYARGCTMETPLRPRPARPAEPEDKTPFGGSLDGSEARPRKFPVNKGCLCSIYAWGTEPTGASFVEWLVLAEASSTAGNGHSRPIHISTQSGAPI